MKPTYQQIYDEKVKQKIRERAYEIYQWRYEYGEPGCALGDWLEAEIEILSQLEQQKHYTREDEA